MINTLAQSRYTAFISYAHADDVACFDWITLFRKELERGLAASLRGVALPPVHQSGDNGPVAGVLGPELRERIEQSFAMVVVVHDNYVLSEWCRKELETFVQVFGPEGCQERLYIVALSEAAVKQAQAGEAWQRLLPAGQLWMPFFDPDKRTQPLEIYLGPQLVAPPFKQQFLRLREDFVAKLKAGASQAAAPIVAGSAVAGAPAPGVAPVAAPAVPQSLLGGAPAPATAATAAGTPAPAASAPPTADVRIYIESNRHEVSLWQPLGEQIRRRWQALAAAQPQAPGLNLRARGLPVEQIDLYPSLDDADGVVLLWGKKTPDALVAQINKVENKMSPGRDAAPGVVAYLMPPQQSADPVPAWGWPVLRFDAAAQGTIDVVPDENDELQDFLQRVLERRLQRAAPAAAPLVAPATARTPGGGT
ncbi:MAG: toll/interleukin-1 receptor domain-containing protein [Rubrivivax sp.]|nr:toll/interleukin-1 receptor domain-containing protein [Rubrivivax sp.]